MADGLGSSPRTGRDVPPAVVSATSFPRRQDLQRFGVFVVVTLITWTVLGRAFQATPVDIHVRWRPAVTDAQRADLERRFRLGAGTRTDSRTWTYQLADASTSNIRALVRATEVEDTDGLDRSRFRPIPEISWLARQRALAVLLASAIVGVALSFILPIGSFGGARRWSGTWSDLVAAMPSNPLAQPYPHDSRVTLAVVVVAGAAGAVVSAITGASLLSALRALAIVYAGGYVTGSLLVVRTEGLALAMVRMVSGLMLTSVAFLLSLVLSLPWFVLPVAVLCAALVVRGRAAFAWPHERMRLQWDGIAAGAIVVVLVAPIAIEYVRMARGPFPEVFYNVDTPRALEEVHALTVARRYPPPSLSSVGVVRTYHYGVPAMAALVSRASGLLPHQAFFLVVLPLLAIGTVAAAVAAGRYLAPTVPLTLAVPLLLLAAPRLTRLFSDGFVPRLWSGAISGTFNLDWITSDYVLWGILSNESQNTDFLVLGSIAAMVSAPLNGWLLPAFLIGSSLVFKTTTGIALVAGLMLAEGWQVIASKHYRPSAPMLLAGAVFLATYAAFYLVSFAASVQVQLYPFQHLRGILDAGRPVTLIGAVVDSLWLLLPALVVTMTISDVRDRERSSLLLMALAPLLVVNATRLVHVGDGGLGAGLEDWLQITRPLPFALHAFALSVAGARWGSLGRVRRSAFIAMAAIVTAPVIVAAATYSSGLLRAPQSGHEFVDNRRIAEALAVIPIRGSMVVTNDLRYPADNFGRDDRQIQIPALFGHQAFSVDFAGEPIEDRRGLQQLLQRPQWTGEIAAAARTHHWTHLLIRKDYVHPHPVPLKQIFENEAYAVYQFP